MAKQSVTQTHPPVESGREGVMDQGRPLSPVHRFEDRFNVAVLCAPLVEQSARALGLDLSDQVTADTLADAVD